MNNGKLRFQFGLLCDDVRREDNGKLILIGVYQGDIQVAKLPEELRLSLVCWFEAQDAQTKEFTLEISLNGQIITTGQVNLSVAKPESVTLIFPHAPLHLKEEGELLFRLKISEDTSYVAWRGPVRLRPSVKQEQ